MPAIRPEAISNRVRLANEVRAAMRRLVAEDCAVDAVLAAVIDEFPPDETGVAVLGSQHDFFTGPDEQLSIASVFVSIG
ncbi:hypothetical protein WJ61_01105 [Burkholderia ubonensis]|nr:hypothetical protein WJ61_01105 [Burkholderia ubonensis]